MDRLLRLRRRPAPLHPHQRWHFRGSSKAIQAVSRIERVSPHHKGTSWVSHHRKSRLENGIQVGGRGRVAAECNWGEATKEFSKGEPQLVAYLAILRENRRRAKKVNYSAQGFYSDGSRFGFVCITEERVIKWPPILDIGGSVGLKMVFSFIVCNDGSRYEEKTHRDAHQAWAPARLRDWDPPRWDLDKIYASVDESVLVSDSDMDDVIDVSWLFCPLLGCNLLVLILKRWKRLAFTLRTPYLNETSKAAPHPNLAQTALEVPPFYRTNFQKQPLFLEFSKQISRRRQGGARRI